MVYIVGGKIYISWKLYRLIKTRAGKFIQKCLNYWALSHLHLPFGCNKHFAVPVKPVKRAATDPYKCTTEHYHKVNAQNGPLHLVDVVLHLVLKLISSPSDVDRIENIRKKCKCSHFNLQQYEILKA